MEAVRTAVILAAGIGRRLGKLGENTPKGLLRIGGESLIRRSMATLENHGIENFVVVVGHLAHLYEKEFLNTKVRLVYNRDFARSGSFYSLIHGLEVLETGALVLDSDIIFEPRSIEVLLKSTSEAAVLTSGETQSGDEVWARTTGDRLEELSKAIIGSGIDRMQEFTGIMRIGEPSIEELRRLYRSDPGLWFFEEYESAISALCKIRRVDVVHQSNLRWAEVDNSEQLNRATRIFARDVHPE